MEEIFLGKAGEEYYADYIDFINYIFGFNGVSQNFIKLLPKLYKPKYEPVKNSYVAIENGKIKAAVGAFDHEIEVCGEKLRCRGIGNVAVHPFTRSKGYMKSLMNMSLDDMVKDGIDISILGGRRQRYNYFSYEPSGTALRFTINSDNIRHTFGADRSSHYSVTIERLREEDTNYLDEIGELLSSQVYNPYRPAEKLYDILCSWECIPYVVLKKGEFAGYLIFKSDKISEILLKDPADFTDVIITLYDSMKLQKLYLTLPPFATDYIGQLYRLCEEYSQSTCMSYTVFNFERVISAFLKLKASYSSLPDGELKMLIHGYAGDESLCISVKDGVGSVSRFDGKADLELEHIDAINLLFSFYCPAREALPAFAKVWLPLPLWLWHTDAV